MPTIDMDIVEFEGLLGVKFHSNMEKLDDVLAYVKSEVKAYHEKENLVTVELKDTNRPDLWSPEGLARTLRSYLKLEEGIRQYNAGKTVLDVQVDPQLKDIRPYIACAVVKDVKLTDAIIRGLMHLQDKLDRTYGRSRQKTSIGLYNLDLITPPLNYTVTDPNATTFTPLGFSEKMSLAEILEKHPKGVEYGHIVKKNKVYPILLDAEKKVLSFPPITNSNDLGKITEEDKNLLVEVTGTTHQTVVNNLTLVTSALIDRGGKAYSTNIHYSDKSEVTPDFNSKLMKLNIEYANRILGLKLSGNQMADLLVNAGLGINQVTSQEVTAIIPCYRVDVMHPVDLIEDVAVAYGYNNIEPLWRDLPTIGAPRPQQRVINVARELMVGAGYQEILTYTLTNPENLFTKMNFENAKTVELFNPKVVTMTCLRNWLLPNLMEFLSVNQSVTFPQQIFELGKITLLDETKETKTRDEEWLAAATSHPTANFSEIKADLDAFFTNLGVKWQIKATIHSSFIEGRTGTIIVADNEVGIIGEIHPQVLEAWNLENPTAAFELNIEKILVAKRK